MEERLELPRVKQTPHGPLYRPPSEWTQILVLVASFVLALSLGSVLGWPLGPLSESAVAALHVPYVVVWFSGYALWIARLNALGFELLGRSLLLALFRILILRKKPKDIEELVPSAGKLEEFAVRAQKAGNSFAWAGYLWAFPCGLLAGWIDSERGALFQVVWVFSTVAAWGHLLSGCARRGILPFLEEG